MYVSLGIITLLNFVMAGSLELYADEAYYALYSRFPDWGYFDHPPAVGILIFIGTLFAKTELGVRIIFILLTSASYYLLYDWIKPKNYSLFWLVVLALFPVQLMGFMALPDMPLFFFAILFFRCFQRYIQNESLLNIFLLALCIAGMLYSKYHGALIILFSFFAVPKFFLRKSFYLLTLISVLLYLPHFIWLYQHEFSSIQYHFFERSASTYRFSFTLEYIAAFIFYNGPLVFALLLWNAFTSKSANNFESVLKVNILGFFLFFLLSSFKGRVEANWTFMALIPALYLGFSQEVKFEKLLRTSAIISLALIALFRIHLLHPIVEFKKDRAYEYRGHANWASEIFEHSKGKPIVANRYQEASLLSYYGNQFVPAININSRKNQFDFWATVDAFENKDVLILKRGDAPEGTKQFLHPYFGKYYLAEIKSLQLLRYPEILAEEIKQEGNTVKVSFKVKTQNSVQSERAIYTRVAVFNEEARADTLLELSIQAINNRELQQLQLAWPYSGKIKHLEIEILSDSLEVWKNKKVQIENGRDYLQTP